MRERSLRNSHETIEKNHERKLTEVEIRASKSPAPPAGARRHGTETVLREMTEEKFSDLKET